MKHAIIILASAAAVAGCGGGGGSDSETNPVASYVGNYSGACSGHAKSAVVVSSPRSGVLELAERTDYYMDSGCAGSIVGSESWPNPTSAVLSSHANQVPVSDYPTQGASSVVSGDVFAVSVPAMSTTVAGSGVTTSGSQKCISYTGGSTCLSQRSYSAQTGIGLLATDGAKLIVATPNGSGGYVLDESYARN